MGARRRPLCFRAMMPDKMTSCISRELSETPPRAPVRRWHGLADEWLSGPLGRFLEYGCGPCSLTARVADRCDECHGVDVDEERIAASQAQYPEYNLSVIGLDGRTSYDANSFDTAAIIEVIEHVPNERATLMELARWDVVLRSPLDEGNAQ